MFIPNRRGGHPILFVIIIINFLPSVNKISKNQYYCHFKNIFNEMLVIMALSYQILLQTCYSSAVILLYKLYLELSISLVLAL